MILKIQNLSFSYHKKELLKNINLELQKKYQFRASK